MRYAASGQGMPYKAYKMLNSIYYFNEISSK